MRPGESAPFGVGAVSRRSTPEADLFLSFSTLEVTMRKLESWACFLDMMLFMGILYRFNDARAPSLASKLDRARRRSEEQRRENEGIYVLSSIENDRVLRLERLA
jgi:hypothetical protein